jgi:hypothetical protein
MAERRSILARGFIFSILHSQFFPIYGWGVIAIIVMVEIRPLTPRASGP